jgi:hypothetical protein
MEEVCSNLENHCLVLLCFLADNPIIWQTYRNISRDTGIPLTTLYEIVNGFREYGPNEWALGGYADRYGFEVEYIGAPGRILFVGRKV